MSANRLSKATGIPQPTITRFLNGAELKLETYQILCDHFGIKMNKQRK